MKALGDHYERLAADWLRCQGLQILERNFRARTGEIDLIAMDASQLVFIEVRARGNPGFSSAAGSVTRRKQQRIIATAQRFLQARPQLKTLACRFDVVTFDPRQAQDDAGIHWIRSAFTA
ncbi:MAG: YraN family protein [Halioglobus sp.]|nr:YraN family protein [Halioglobus sp.]